MGRMIRFLSILGLFASTAFAQNIATPVFVLKDGDATAAAYTGTDKSIYVDGGAQQSVGWITFQTQGIDMSKIASAKLVLYVNALTSPGTLQVRLLTADITAPENNVRLSLVTADVAIAASQALGTADVEKIVQIDLTTAVKSGTFKGIALTSDDGLAASFDSKEGHLKPMVLLTNNVNDVAAVWLSGTSAPAAGLGKDGDYYLNSASGDVSAKTAGAWAVVTNIVGAAGATGAKGDKGETGATGAPGAKGDPGANGTDGAIGPQGVAGPTGATGATGPAGAVGAVGAKGDKGDKGDPGLTGANGTNGSQGPAGADGKSIVWRTAWSADSSYSVNDAVSYSGSSYIAIKTSANKVPADSVTYWSLLANKGDQGIQGLTGNTGTKGDKGDKGDAGANGTNGINGAKGDKGDKGETGSQGIKGDAGVAGAAGSNGTNGIDGLPGAKGDKGDQGAFPSGTAAGDMQYWNGSAWVMIPAGGANQILTNVTTDKIPRWIKRPMGTVMDIDGNEYHTIVIGNQEWTCTNLKTTKLNDGTAIPNVTDNTAWAALITPGYCWYGNDVANKDKYGALYNWYTVNTGTLAPVGWRVPDTTDWIKLENYLIANGYNYDGTTSGNKIAKSMAAGMWTSCTGTGAIGNNLGLNNKSGFSALPGGSRWDFGPFGDIDAFSYWWCATEHDASNAWNRYLYVDYSSLNRYDVSNLKSSGEAVRLVRDLN